MERIKIFVITIIIIMIMFVGIGSVGAQTIAIFIDGQKQNFDQSPIIQDGRTLVPLRGIFESLGATVDWNASERKITAVKNSNRVELTLGSRWAKINHKLLQLDVPANSVNGRTMVPLRFVSEAFGGSVNWDSKSKQVIIISHQAESMPESKPEPEPKLEPKPDQKKEVPSGDLTAQEKELANLINDYRRSLGLEPLKISKSLTTVARLHVQDSNLNSPEKSKDSRGVDCNLHSWSNYGSWNSVCYTSDHYYKELMWSKPVELTNYTGNGYEISARGYGTPVRTLEGWKKSTGHNNVIIGEGFWSNLIVMGVGFDGNYSHVWFGTAEDPEGYYILD